MTRTHALDRRRERQAKSLGGSALRANLFGQDFEVSHRTGGHRHLCTGMRERLRQPKTDALAGPGYEATWSLKPKSG
jgi:hypothetical protein